MIAEIAMNATIRMRITKTCVLSLIFFFPKLPIKSIDKVELEAITSEDKVLIEAERTRTTTSAINDGLKVESIFGMIASNPPSGIPFGPTLRTSVNKRPNPPRKYEPPATTTAKTVEMIVPFLIESSFLIA